MAKAVARCSCRDCGKEFIREAKKYNRKEANAWKEWAERTFTQCTSCYAKAHPPTLTVTFNQDNTALLSWSGNTFNVKDTLKALGYVWGVLPNTFKVGWFMTTTVSEVNSWIEKSKSVPGMNLKEE